MQRHEAHPMSAELAILLALLLTTAIVGSVAALNLWYYRHRDRRPDFDDTYW
jgi:hypothetical protein